MDNTINTSSYINNYTNYCSYRLPCGICQRTNSICPLSGGIYTTWKVTCTAVEDNTDFFTEGHLHLGYAEEGET